MRLNYCVNKLKAQSRHVETQTMQTADCRLCRPGILYFADWTGLDWTGLVKRGLVKRGLVKRGLVKRGLVKRGLVKRGLVKRGLAKRKENVGFINTIIHYSKNFSSENKRYHNS